MTTATANKWKNHTRTTPCPICGKPDRCKFTDDGAHRCFRVQGEVAGWRLVKTCRDGTCIYAMNDLSAPSRTQRRVKPRRVKSVSPEIDWAREAEQFTKALTPDQLNEIAQSLRVSTASLQLLNVGVAHAGDLRRLGVHGQNWDGDYPEYAFTFPEVNSELKVIGICFRAPDGLFGQRHPQNGHKGCLVGGSAQHLLTVALSFYP